MNADAIYVILICSTLASGLYMLTAARPEITNLIAGAEQADKIS